ncbi:MAG: DUF7319 domain-containing protein [Halohasta sp.]
MSDSSDERARESTSADTDSDADGDTEADADPAADTAADGDTAADDLEALRQQVDEKYDFEEFGPADMARMSAEEWEAAFDAETWITGPRLLERVEAELKNRIARRDVFAVVERETVDGADQLLVYSDEGYVTVTPDGTVEGEGGVLRDVEPIVAMCSMEEYEVAEPPAEYELPSPEVVPEQTGELGNLMLQIVAGIQLLGGLGLLVACLLTDVGLVAPTIGGLFVVVGLFLFSVVANARLSDRFRAEQYRDRLRAVEAEGFDRPDLPGGSDTGGESAGDADRGESGDRKTEGA